MNTEKGLVAEVAMDNEVELISDGDGLAVIGNPTAVERFMASVGLSSNAGSPRLGAAFSAGASVAQTGSEIAANSGRWVKLTEESAQAVKKFGLTPTKTPGVSHAMVGQPGDIKQWIQIVKTPGSMVTNPAMLAGAAGIMAQIAMQQQMDGDHGLPRHDRRKARRTSFAPRRTRCWRAWTESISRSGRQ